MSSVVRSSSHDVLSDVLHLLADEYAVRGSRLMKMGCSLSQNASAATAPWWCRCVFWAFRVSGSAKCVTQRGVGLLGSDATGVMLHVILFPTAPSWVRWGDRLLSRVALVLQLGALDLVRVHRGIVGMGMSPLRELVLVPVLVEMSLEKRLKLVNYCDYDAGRLCKVPGLGGSKAETGENKGTGIG